MEEQRISVMYLNLLKRWFGTRWEAMFPRGFMRSRATFLGGLAALVLVPSIGWYLHVQGKFHTAKKDLGVAQAPAAPDLPRPGGADALILTRPQTIGSTPPEFLSVTMVPGLGMGVLQITAIVPGRGEVPLLAAPSLQSLVDEPAGALNGIDDDHGSLELPWGGTLSGVISPLGTTLQTLWHGHQISVSRQPGQRSGLAEGGMLAVQPADSTQLTQIADGVQGTAEFQSTDFAGHWPSRTNVLVSAQLTARTLDLTITAKNVGNDPEPMGIGWLPRFAMAGAELRLPVGDRMELGNGSRAVPTGKFTPPGDALAKFLGHAAPLNAAGTDETLAHLRPGLLDNAAAAELRDSATGFGLRLISMSPSIRALHVVVPQGAPYVALGLQTNYDDAFGKEWNGDGIATLAPGDTLQWKVRLEIFAITKH